MFKRAYNFLAESNIIHDLQFAFRQLFYTSHRPLNFTEDKREALDERYIGCGTFLVQNFFDTVDHEMLLSKIEYYGIRGKNLVIKYIILLMILTCFILANLLKNVINLLILT